MNLPEILALKFPNIDFIKDVKLRDIGKGPEIYEWNLEDPKPTQEDLDQWAIEFDLPFRQQQAVSKRQYPPIGAQLDMMFHDFVEKTSVWVDTISAIKLSHPKPKE